MLIIHVLKFLATWIRTLGCFEDYPELNVSDFYIDVLSDKHVGIVGNGVAGKNIRKHVTRVHRVSET